MIKVIKTRLTLENRFLNKNIKTHILEQLKLSLVNTCSKENGYILDVLEVLQIIDNIIDNTNSVPIFNILCKIEYLKPEINSVYNGDVCMIFEHGIFTDIKNKFKVLIPIDSLEKFDYYSEENVFKNDKLTICMDSNINCKLTSIKYEKNQFICIGELVL